MSDDKIISRIKKCLALSKSANPNEAAQAIKTAQRLMMKHNVQQFDVSVTQTRCGVKLGARVPDYINMLVGYLSSAFSCSAIYSLHYERVERWNSRFNCYQHTDKKVTVVDFVGELHASSVCSYTFEVLHRLLHEQRKTFVNSLHRNNKKSTKTGKADAFCYGWVVAVARQLPDMSVADDLIKDRESYIEKHFGDTLMKAKDRKTINEKHDDFMREGYSEGLNVDVSKGVNGLEKQKLERGVG